MHIETIRFDEVFDVQSRRGDFSFRSGERTEYGVHLRSKTVPRPGATYTIAFGKPGRWDTVLGWRDLASREVVLSYPNWIWWLLPISDIVFYGLLIAGPLLLGGAWGALAAVLLAGGLAGWQIVRMVRQNRAVAKALRPPSAVDERV